MKLFSKAAWQQQSEEARVGRISVISVLVWVAIIGMALLNRYLAL